MLYDKKWDQQPAENCLSAEELQISTEEYTALKQVLQMLESGEIQTLDPNKRVDRQQVPKGLWMATSSTFTACGTAACIGGWVAALMRVDMDSYVNRYHCYSVYGESPLNELYWGHVEGDTTTKQAAQAIRNFFVTGNPMWAAVLKT